MLEWSISALHHHTCTHSHHHADCDKAYKAIGRSTKLARGSIACARRRAAGSSRGRVGTVTARGAINKSSELVICHKRTGDAAGVGTRAR